MSCFCSVFFFVFFLLVSYVYSGGKSGSAGSRRPAKTTISVNDRVSVFLELAEAHRLLGNQVIKQQDLVTTELMACQT